MVNGESSIGNSELTPRTFASIVPLRLSVFLFTIKTFTGPYPKKKPPGEPGDYYVDGLVSTGK